MTVNFVYTKLQCVVSRGESASGAWSSLKIGGRAARESGAWYEPNEPVLRGLARKGKYLYRLQTASQNLR